MIRFPRRPVLPCVLLAMLAAPAQAQGHTVGWGLTRLDSSWHDNRFVAMAGGTNCTFGLTGDGRLLGWGSSAQGLFEVPALPPGLEWVDVAAFGHALGLRSDGSVVGWGRDASGETTAPALPIGTTYAAIGAGWEYSAALRSDGEIVVWGDSSRGQHNVPPLPPGLSWVEIAVGDFHMLARRSDGEVFAWGQDLFGETTVPALPPATSYVELAVGTGFSMARRSDGAVLVWGFSSYGLTSVPALPPGTSWTQISAGRWTAAGRRSDGEIVVWGSSQYGQDEVPPLPANTSWLELEVSYGHVLALRSDGVLAIWGRRSGGEGNLPALPPGRAYTQVSAGSGHFLAVADDGQLAGAEGHPAGAAAAPALPPGVGYVRAAAGRGQSLALRSDGQAVAWGSGSTSVPSLPPGVSYVDVAAAGTNYIDFTQLPIQDYERRFAVCLTSAGDAVAFGNNSYGQINVPPLPPGVTYTAVALGPRHTLLVRSDGQIAAFGDNRVGQCNVPALPPGVTWVAVAAGGSESDASSLLPIPSSHSLGLRSDGVLVGWGSGLSGQTTVPALPPGTTWVAFAAGLDSSIGLRSDGALVEWGASYGPAPALTAGQSVTAIAAGERRRLAVVDTGYRIFGEGCPSTVGMPRLVPLAPAQLGAVMRVDVGPLPLDLAVFATGGDDTSSPFGPLPLAGTPFGMPGCHLHVRPDFVNVLFGQQGWASFEFAVPAAPVLVGLPVFQQALIGDPTANPAGMVLSRAGATTVVP